MQHICYMKFRLLAIIPSVLMVYSLPAQTTDLVALVNPLMGSDSKHSLSNGNTYPAIAMPWGMHAWTPQTGAMGDGWQYQYGAEKIVGLKQTHQPSPWINDYGAFSIMPLTGKLRWREKERASWFSHKAETASPHYYQVYLADHNVVAELTPTDRAAQLQFTWPQADSAWVVIDAYDKGSAVTISADGLTVTGYSSRNSGGVPENFRNYFVMQLSRPAQLMYTVNNDVLSKDKAASGNHSMAVLGFKTRKGEKLNIRVASSFISEQQAWLNLRREIGQDDFATTRRKGWEAWQNELKRIEVQGGTEAQRRTFYSCLYRVLLFPRKFYELDEKNQVVHYSPYNGQVLPGYMFTDNGFWDTFRAVFPFFTLMYPDLNAQIMQGLVNTYKESGWLPEWASPGHRDCMIGSNSASLIADAWLKGIRGYDINLLWEALVKNANNEGPVSSVGRRGVQHYNRLGYVPSDVGINESAARSLEYAYADFCLWKLGESLGRPKAETDVFKQRSQNYRLLFDDTTRLMRGRKADGRFAYPFNPFKWGDAFTEGNSWHYSWSVFHDVEGLKQKMGGDKGFISMLDSVFNLPPDYDESYYGFVIHEIREMQIMNMGQYAHGNQPIQHMPYLYNYTSQPWKTQQRVRQVMDRLYHPGPDGYCGDEDNGQTSAWYVFSAMGFYPVCPGTDEYVLGSPLFDRVILTMPGGKKTQIDARGNGPDNVFVQQLMHNGKGYPNRFVRHADLQEGGKWEFTMGANPPAEVKGSELKQPYSMSNLQPR